MLDSNAAEFGSVLPQNTNPFMDPQFKSMSSEFPTNAGSENAFGNFPPLQFPPFLKCK